MSPFRTALVAAIALAGLALAGPAQALASAGGAAPVRHRPTPSPTPSPVPTPTPTWNGSSWTVVPTANGNAASGGTNVLRAVAGVSGADLWAVGSYLDAGGHTLTLVEHYTG